MNKLGIVVEMTVEKDLFHLESIREFVENLTFGQAQLSAFDSKCIIERPR